jgi:hypothetical protein
MDPCTKPILKTLKAFAKGEIVGWDGGQGFFYLSTLWCSQSGHHPENNWAKFGYILDMKVGPKKIESFYVLGYLLELIFKIWWIWSIVSFQKKSFVYVETWWKFTSRRNTGKGKPFFNQWNFALKNVKMKWFSQFSNTKILSPPSKVWYWVQVYNQN